MIKLTINFLNLQLVTVLFISYVISLTLLKTFFSIEIIKKYKKDDYISTLFYFLLFFLFLLFIPFLIIFIKINLEKLSFYYFKQILSNLFKLNIGNYKLGIIFCLISIPLIIIIQLKQDPEIISFYPFAKSTLKNKKKFLIIESFYFIFYYITWEAFFRGFLQNFIFFILNQDLILKELLQNKMPYSNYLFFILIISISIQTIISTLFHIGHPKTEILASLFGGFLFGTITVITNSVLYNIFIHAFLGITTDFFILIRKNKSNL
ncbi:MAG: hypothetical protein N3A58_03255 [Spirochaetes bacterium]|nr:hypothetical protein [Spirochaetota bacterium]